MLRILGSIDRWSSTFEPTDDPLRWSKNTYIRLMLRPIIKTEFRIRMWQTLQQKFINSYNPMLNWI